MRTFLFFLLLFLGFHVFSQNFSQYENIPLNTAADYRRIEPQISLACDLILSTPVEKKNKNRNDAVSFMMKWMGGTSDYSFMPDETLKKIINNDKELLSVYCAGLAKYALQKGKGVDRNEMKYNAYLVMADYCEIPENNLKPYGEVKKLIEAKNKNQLKEFLDKKK